MKKAKPYVDPKLWASFRRATLRRARLEAFYHSGHTPDCNARRNEGSDTCECGGFEKLTKVTKESA